MRHAVVIPRHGFVKVNFFFQKKISESTKAVGFLDVMCAFAGYARATGAVKPELTEEIFHPCFVFSCFLFFSQLFSCFFMFLATYFRYGTSFIDFFFKSFFFDIFFLSNHRFAICVLVMCSVDIFKDSTGPDCTFGHQGWTECTSNIPI